MGGRDPKDSTSTTARLPPPQRLSLSRPCSYSIAGIACDARAGGECRPPEMMLYSPRRGLVVGERRHTSSASLAALSAPKVRRLLAFLRLHALRGHYWSVCLAWLAHA